MEPSPINKTLEFITLVQFVMEEEEEEEEGLIKRMEDQFSGAAVILPFGLHAIQAMHHRRGSMDAPPTLLRTKSYFALLEFPTSVNPS